MLENYEKKKQLIEKRRQDERKKARENIKRYNTGENKDQGKKVLSEAKDLKNIVTPWGLVGLLGQMSIVDWPYWLALIAAGLKDLLDPLELTGIFYMVILILTLCISIFIGFMMLLASFSTGYGKMQQKLIRSYLVLFAGTTIELLPGIGLVPIETLTVLIVYGMYLNSKKKNRETEKKNSILSQKQYTYLPKNSEIA